MACSQGTARNRALSAVYVKNSLICVGEICDGNQWGSPLVKATFHESNKRTGRRVPYKWRKICRNSLVTICSFYLENVGQDDRVRPSQWRHSMVNIKIYKSRICRFCINFHRFRDINIWNIWPWKVGQGHGTIPSYLCHSMANSAEYIFQDLQNPFDAYFWVSSHLLPFERSELDKVGQGYRVYFRNAIQHDSKYRNL